MKIEEIDAIHYKNGKAEEAREHVVLDETITLTINGDISRSLSAIEDSLEEFAVGYLFNENMVNSMDAIKKIEVDGTQINAEIDDTLLKTNETVLCSDSAGGWRSKIIAGIVYNNQFIVKEDVSRHVAVDKVIGYGLIHGFDLSRSYVIYSGRMPADMVIKMTRAGVPILASNAAPANSGFNIAKKGNITLVGFLRGQRCNIYNNQNRIIF